MSDNLFEAQYDVTKKSRFKKFYDSNKILIFSFIFIITISFVSFSLYLENKEKKKILLSDNYIQSKIYLEKGNKDKAINLLKESIFADDPTYSSLSLFLLVNQNLIEDYEELSSLFEHLLENNKFSKELESLLIYKKAILDSNFVDESKLIESFRPLLTSGNIWKPHALLLLGDYFMSKGDNIKAIEFYQEVFSIKNLHQDLYSYAKSQLEIISNE